MIVGLVSTLLSLVITILTAFAFARLEFKGKELLFAALLATMMIPGELFTITNYGTITTFGWKNTYTVLIVPFLVSVFYIYLLRQSFLQIPNELYLAAKVDGTKRLQIPVEGHGAPVPAHADFHHHPENDGRVELLHLAASGGERRRAPADYQRPAQRLHRHHGRRELSRADGGRRAGIRSRCSWCSCSCASTSCPASAAAVSRANQADLARPVTIQDSRTERKEKQDEKTALPFSWC